MRRQKSTSCYIRNNRIVEGMITRGNWPAILLRSAMKTSLIRVLRFPGSGTHILDVSWWTSTDLPGKHNFPDFFQCFQRLPWKMQGDPEKDQWFLDRRNGSQVDFFLNFVEQLSRYSRYEKHSLITGGNELPGDVFFYLPVDFFAVELFPFNFV